MFNLIHIDKQNIYIFNSGWNAFTSQICSYDFMLKLNQPTTTIFSTGYGGWWGCYLMAYNGWLRHTRYHTTWQPYIQCTKQLQVGRWYHVCITLSGGYISYYIDGEPCGSGGTSCDGRWADTVNSATCGYKIPGENYVTDFSFGMYRVYGKVLSLDEVKRLQYTIMTPKDPLWGNIWTCFQYEGSKENWRDTKNNRGLSKDWAAEEEITPLLPLIIENKKYVVKRAPNLPFNSDTIRKYFQIRNNPIKIM